MENVYNREKKKWIRPWNMQKFDDLYNRDDRFFSVLVKGTLGWLTRNIILYDKPIKHFIFNTGSSYMYVESNGYEFSWSETTGEDWMYMQMPRCIVEINDIRFPKEELTNPYSWGSYERLDDNLIKGFSAEIRRVPIEMSISLKYVLSNFNESMILTQELLDKILFQQYFEIVYLGQTIKCSIEFPDNTKVEINKIDMTSSETNQKNINLDLTICTNYPQINERTEISNNTIIYKFEYNTELYGSNSDINSDDWIEKDKKIIE